MNKISTVICLFFIHFSQYCVAGSSTYELNEVTLSASDGMAEDNFGHAIAASNDILVVGSPNASVDNKEDAGAVYIFLRDADTNEWFEHSKLLADDSTAFQQFGSSVAIDMHTIIIGAPGTRIEDQASAGVVYVFEHNDEGNTWTQTAKITSPSPKTSAKFGNSVAIEGDRIVIGAVNTHAERRGKAYVFRRSDNTELWNIEATLIGMERRYNNDKFGNSVAIDGDWILVGAPNVEVECGTVGLVSCRYLDFGAAFLFERNQGGSDAWGLVNVFSASDAEKDDHFGSAVALDQDKVVIGAPLVEGPNDENSVGAAYIYEHDYHTNDWIETDRLQPNDLTARSYFGESVFISNNSIQVAAYGTTIGNKDSQGAVYLYEKDDDNESAWNEIQIVASDGSSGERFGSALTIENNTRIISAKDANNFQGVVYVYTDNNSILSEPAVEEVITFIPNGELIDDSLFTSPDGVILGATEDTVLETLPVWVHKVQAPELPLFEQATPVGDYYNIGAEHTTFLPHDSAFGIGLPVPEGSDTEHLAVAVLIDGKKIMHSDSIVENIWIPVEGGYDPEGERYIIPTYRLDKTGNVFVLVEHPELSPLLNSGDPEDLPLSEPDFEDHPIFEVQCMGFTNSSSCTSVDEAWFEEQLREAYWIYKELGFKEPALHKLEIKYKCLLYVTLCSYSIEEQGKYTGNYIYPTTSYECNPQRSVKGLYVIRSHTFIFCKDPQRVGEDLSPNEANEITVRHELFHAIQNSYTLLNISSFVHDGWVYEGMATVASTDPPSLKRNIERKFHPINLSLSSPIDYSNELIYRAQDFWSFYLKKYKGGELAYLHDILEYGMTTNGVNNAIKKLSPVTNLSEVYWEWVKNQAMENTIELEGSVSNPCRLSGKDVAIAKPPYYKAEYKKGKRLEVKSNSDRGGPLDKLTSDLIAVRFETKKEYLDVSFTVEELGSHTGNIKYRVYESLDAECTRFDDGERTFENISDAASVPRFYVLISNTDLYNSINYKLIVEEGEGG